MSPSKQKSAPGTPLLRKEISLSALQLLVLAAFLLLLAPYLYLGRYDVPCADDYIFGTAAHMALSHGGTAGDVLAAAAGHTAFIYKTWQGSYAAVFLMCLQPAAFSEGFYALTPWLMCASLFGGLFALCLCLCRRVFDLPAQVGVIAAGLLGILWLLLCPYPVESFYWYNGAVYYSFFHGLALLALALAVPTAQRGGVLRIPGLCLLAAVLGGGNLMTGLSLSILAAGGLGLLLLTKRAAMAKRLLLPTLVLLGCFCLNVFAPGNALRQAGETHVPAALPAIGQSFLAGLRFAVSWFRLPVLGVLLALGLVFWAVLPASRFPFRYPGLVTLGSYCLFSAMFCPTLYAMGTAGPGRLQDIIFYSYLLLLTLNLLYWLGWLRKRRRGEASCPRLLPVLGALALCVLLTGVSALLRGGVSLASLYTAYAGGQARRYRAEAEARLTILRDPEVRVAELEPYSDPPYLLYFDDIQPDPEAWQNRDMANFYGKERVVLLPASEPGSR